MSSEHEQADEPPAELEGQTSINDHLIAMGEKPVLNIVVAAPTDEEIAAFLDGEAGRG